MTNFRLSPKQFVFIEQVLRSQTINVWNSSEVVSLVECVKKARQSDDGLVDLMLDTNDVRYLLSFIGETTIKVKNVDFVMTVVGILQSASGSQGFSSEEPASVIESSNELESDNYKEEKD